jgi:hypothetical protein
MDIVRRGVRIWDFMARRKKSKNSQGFRWGKFLGISGVVLALLLVGLSAAVYFVAKGFLHSDKFRLLLSERASDVFKAEGEFESFSYSGSAVYSDKFTAQGYDNAVFSKVKAEGIEANIDIGGVRRGVWAIPSVKIQRVNVLMDGDRLKKREEVAVTTSEPSSDGGDTRGFFQRMIPDKVELDKAMVNELNFDLVPKEGQPMRGRGIVVEAVPTDTEMVFKVDGNSGTFEMGGLPENLKTLEIVSFSLRTASKGVFLDNADLRFRDAEPGKVVVSGDIKTGKLPDLALKARFRDVPGDRILPNDWVQKLKGSFSGELDINGPGGSEIEGFTSLANGSLEALPVLANIDKMAETTKFRRLLLSTLRADFHRKGDRLAIREFDIESAGIICAKGWLDYQNGSLQGGRYMLGITPDTIRWMPEWKRKIVEQVFRQNTASAFAGLFPADPDIKTPPDGYLWTVVAVDPLAMEPYAADLRAQFVQAGGLALWAELEGMSAQAIGAALEISKQATENGVNLLEVVTGNQLDQVFGVPKEENEEGEPKKGGLLDIPGSVMKTGVDAMELFSPFNLRNKNTTDKP